MVGMVRLPDVVCEGERVDRIFAGMSARLSWLTEQLEN